MITPIKAHVDAQQFSATGTIPTVALVVTHNVVHSAPQLATTQGRLAHFGG